MQLSEFLDPDLIFVLEDVSTHEALIERLAAAAGKALPGAGADRIAAALREREEQSPTSTPEGVGFPHALLPQLERTIVIVARLPKGVPSAVEDHPPVDLVFCIVGGSEEPWRHVRLLARIARVARGPGALKRFRSAESAEALLEALREEDRTHV